MDVIIRIFVKEVGDQVMRYVGALCKECDIYNKRGLGKFA